MTQVDHGTFTIERTFDAPIGMVFRAFADPDVKERWFSGPPDWESGPHELDFRVGGRERSSGGPPGGFVSVYDATYMDIVPNERIINAYEMQVDGARISVSLATLEFTPDGERTRLKFTEQGAFLAGADGVAMREQGTRDAFDALEQELQRQLATA